VSELVLYSRPGCHLCDDARAVVERVRARLGAAAPPLVEVDITADDALHARYLERIPVLTVDGQERFEYFVDEAELLTVLRGSVS
jgi:glutaredoxin